MEFTLLWAAFTAIAFAWAGTRLWSERLPDHPTDRIIGAAAAGLLVGRLVAMMVQGINPILHPLDILLVRGGVHSGAATIGAIVAYLWAAKWTIRYLDATAPAAVFGLAGWHAGCLWRGACLGTASDLPWAWAEPGSLISRHPVELYTALGLGVAAWIVSRLSWRLLTRAGAALALAGFTRLLTEPLRPSLTGGPFGWYITALALGVVAIWLGPRLGERRITAPT
jgi:prolipoprotein diacylglyceryltransferase